METNKKEIDEIGGTFENAGEINAAIEQQGNDAVAGILRDTDAAKHQYDTEDAEPEKQD